MKVYWITTTTLLVVSGWFFLHFIHEAETMTQYWIVAGSVCILAIALHQLLWWRFVGAKRKHKHTDAKRLADIEQNQR